MKFKPTVFALLLAAQPFIGNMALAADEVAAATETPTQQQVQSSKLNINTATAEQFMALKGIGKKTFAKLRTLVALTGPTTMTERPSTPRRAAEAHPEARR